MMEQIKGYLENPRNNEGGYYSTCTCVGSDITGGIGSVMRHYK